MGKKQKAIQYHEEGLIDSVLRITADAMGSNPNKPCSRGSCCMRLSEMTPERCDLAAKVQLDQRGDQFPGYAWLCQYDIGSATCMGKKVRFDPQDSRDACWELLED